jgi:hypothetical protein
MPLRKASCLGQKGCGRSALTDDASSALENSGESFALIRKELAHTRENPTNGSVFLDALNMLKLAFKQVFCLLFFW